jgi:hypothetical protein
MVMLLLWFLGRENKKAAANENAAEGKIGENAVGCVSMRTSGKAPLEKTLHSKRISSTLCSDQMVMHCIGREAEGDGRRLEERAAENDGHQHSHQQTGFTAGTVANDDELSADLSHGVCEVCGEMD